MGGTDTAWGCRSRPPTIVMGPPPRREPRRPEPRPDREPEPGGPPPSEPGHRLDPPTTAVLVAIDLAGLLGIVCAIHHSPGASVTDWVLFAMLTACALAYTELTAAGAERRRRARERHGSVGMVDQASIWFFGAALLLPPMLAALVVVVVRIRGAHLIRRPAALWIANMSAVLLSVAGVSVVRAVIADDAWPRDFASYASEHGLRVMALLAISAVVYFVLEAALVGVYRGVRSNQWTLRETLGSREDNLFLAHTLLVGLGAVVAGAIMPVALIGVLAVAVMETRTLGRLAARTADRDRLRIDATTDLLTGLRNRRGFEPTATAALALDQAACRPTAVLMLDLDHFKQWNERLSHFGGDQVLRAVADVLRGQTRAGDLTARWGGEELAVVLPDTTLFEANAIAERIRAAVEALDTWIVPATGGPRLRLGADMPPCTVSIGVACAPEHGTTLTYLQELADRALGTAKRNGRNQVVLLGHAVPGLPTQPGPEARS
ncbi:GGDEF domain-containing protein [Actinokineospora inagensis]|uniref:GGDEF domain-containing protein n=1 Tax=Actinokineospora inagensis TaxID=103730 RepID=UPI000413D7F3|nr:diguanylate cyclase [Actinokineospora inagensis]